MDCIARRYGFFWNGIYRFNHTSYRWARKSVIWTNRIELDIQDIVKVSWEIIRNALKEWYFPMSVTFRYLDMSRSKTSGYWSERPNKVYEGPKNGALVMVWYAVSRKQVVRFFSFEIKNVTGGTWNKLHLYYAFSKLGEYPEDTIFDRKVPFGLSVLVH